MLAYRALFEVDDAHRAGADLVLHDVAVDQVPILQAAMVGDAVRAR